MRERLEDHLSFVTEVDKLKSVLRQTTLLDGSRRENSAEHSWHLAVMAMVFEEHAIYTNLDLTRVQHMLLLHDIVEIDAGDIFVYDTEAMKAKAEKEQRAADRLFGLLPDDQAEQFRALWEEFEAKETPEAKYAGALDRLQPVLHNIGTQGRAWQKHGVRHHQVLAMNSVIGETLPVVWQKVKAQIDEGVELGWLLP
jgi:putative hydrolase of HD superfamily